MNKPTPWKTISSKEVYKNPWIRVREDAVINPAGKEGVYGVIESDDAAFIIALTADDKVYLVEQFRYPEGTWTLELPAGGSEDGEDMAQAARRELQEEIGVIPEKLEKIGEFRTCTGIMTEHSHVFLATGLTETDHVRHEEGIEEPRLVTVPELFKLIDTGEIDDGQCIAALYYFRHWCATNRPELLA